MQVMCELSRPLRVAVAAVVAGVLLGACGSARPTRVINEANIPVVAVRPGSVTPQSTLGGLIAPYQNIQITNNLVEPADAVYVVEGQHVAQGQLLAQLDTQDLEAELKSQLGTIASDEAKTKQTYLQSGLTIVQNSNSINAAQAAVRQAQQTLANDTLNLTRDAQLVKQGYLAQATYDQQNTLVTNDQQALRSAQVALQNTQEQVRTNGTTSTGLQGATIASVKADEQVAEGTADQLRVQIAKARIVSPIDGIVVNRNLNPGEYPGTRQIFTIQEGDKVYAVLNGSGGQIVGVPVGSPVKIVSSDSATLQGTAKVAAVLDQLTPGSTNFIVKAQLPNARGRFHSGMVVTGVITRRTTTGMRIPRSAFTDDTQSTVQTIVSPSGTGAGQPGGSARPGGSPRPGAQRGGVIKTLPVTLVAEDDKNAIVEGLHSGQMIVLNGQLGLSDGQPAIPQTGKGRRAPTVAEQ